MKLVIVREHDGPNGKEYEPVLYVPRVAEVRALLVQCEAVVRQYVKGQVNGDPLPRRLPEQGREALAEIYRLQESLKQ